MDFWNNPSKHKQLIDSPTKRISTPAGQRLSVVLENGNAPAKTRDSHRASMRKSALATTIMGDVPRESIEYQTDRSGYSYSVWSESEKLHALRNNKQVAKRGGWRKLIIIVAMIIALIIVLAVGLAVGLKKGSSSDTNGDSSSNKPKVTTETNTANSADSANSVNPANPTATVAGSLTISPSSLPANFPIGSYSYVTFLDTVQDSCTSLASTWTCYPYVIYNDSPSKSITTFNWIISGSASALKISSTTNPFSISFEDVDLELLSEGEDDERYRFALQTQKTVSPSSSITSDDAAVECDYNDSTLTGVLYTKREKGFPNAASGDATGDPSYPVWPFEVRVEQTAAGGQDVPSCHKTSSPQTVLSDITEAQDATTLCSCLYKNWRTPTPT